ALDEVDDEVRAIAPKAIENSEDIDLEDLDESDSDDK
ncbi:MAG: hypothetical protein RLZZ125_718, partial [Actinomycetota bacterium]